MGGHTLVGRVVSNRMRKTVVVAVGYVVWVPKYKVYERRVSRFKAHDEKQDCVVGDLVKIERGRHYTKSKYYDVKTVIKKMPVYDQAAAEEAAKPNDPPSAVEAATRQLDAAQQRLAALRQMLDKELGGQPRPAVTTSSAGGAGHADVSSSVAASTGSQSSPTNPADEASGARNGAPRSAGPSSSGSFASGVRNMSAMTAISRLGRDQLIGSDRQHFTGT